MLWRCSRRLHRHNKNKRATAGGEQTSIVTWQHTYTVEAVNHLGRKTLEVTLAPVSQPVSFVAGQFVFVRFGGGYEWERHPFTISSAPQESLLRLSIKGLGE